MYFFMYFSVATRHSIQTTRAIHS